MMAGVASKVLFLRNEHLATEALLGEAFANQGFDVEVFEVVPAQRIAEYTMLKQIRTVAHAYEGVATKVVTP